MAGRSTGVCRTRRHRRRIGSRGIRLSHTQRLRARQRKPDNYCRRTDPGTTDHFERHSDPRVPRERHRYNEMSCLPDAVSDASCGAGHTASHAPRRVTRAIPSPHARRRHLNLANVAANHTKEARYSKSLFTRIGCVRVASARALKCGQPTDMTTPSTRAVDHVISAKAAMAADATRQNFWCR